MQSLLPWQLPGVTFLTEPNPQFSKPHRYLAWATGVGKTPIVCEALKKIGATSAIIICTASTKKSWYRHLVDWDVFKADDIHVYEGSYDFARINKKCLIINYELFDYEIIHKQFADPRRGLFDVIVVDEAHRLANWKSERAKKIIGANKPVAGRCYHKWFISATPMPNRSMELYTPVRVLGPELIAPHDAYEKYGKYFCNGYQDGTGVWNFKGNSNTAELKVRLSPLFSVKTYDDLKEAGIPGVIEDDVYLDIGTVIDDEGKPVDDTICDLASLRHHTGVTKTPYAVDFIRDRLEADAETKILVYFFHRKVGEKLRHLLQDYCAVLVYGEMSQASKDEAVKSFRKLKNVRALIAQEDTIGTGYDGIQDACHTIIRVEPCWSGGKYQQNSGRLRRFGQTEITMISNLIAIGTVDDKVSRSCDRKIGTITQLFSNDGENMAVLEQAVEALNRIATALETLASNGVQQETPAPKAKDKPAAKEEETKADEPVGGGPTLEDLRKKAAEVMKVIKSRNGGNAEPGKTVLQKAVGQFAKDSKLDSVKPKDYKKLDAIFDGLLEEPKSDDDDMGV